MENGSFPTTATGISMSHAIGLKQAEATALAVAEIADETGQPLSIVTSVYDEEFANLKAGAHITDYVPLFAARRTRDRLATMRPRTVGEHEDHVR
jgi:hypothetical protein